MTMTHDKIGTRPDYVSDTDPRVKAAVALIDEAVRAMVPHHQAIVDGDLDAVRTTRRDLGEKIQAAHMAVWALAAQLHRENGGVA